MIALRFLENDFEEWFFYAAKYEVVKVTVFLAIHFGDILFDTFIEPFFQKGLNISVDFFHKYRQVRRRGKRAFLLFRSACWVS